LKIREERPVDAEAIRIVNLAAFGTTTEADLVESLRRHGAPIISLVAEEEPNIVGHIMFSPVTLDGQGPPALMGLAPMAVVPARQRRGIGASIVVEGLERCRHINAGAVVVLGHAEYYPRFGFVPASRFSLRCEYDVPENVFMVRELHGGALKGVSGTVRYHPVLANV
jgi:putative acetyltransferase